MNYCCKDYKDSVCCFRHSFLRQVRGVLKVTKHHRIIFDLMLSYAVIMTFENPRNEREIDQKTEILTEVINPVKNVCQMFVKKVCYDFLIMSSDYT